MPHDPTSRDLSADFDHILNWRLLKGSHAFPGPDGGTCINEAAIVAAGLPYRQILGPQDCPPCFSRPLAAYALGLNDAMPDGARARLMAFVLRLSGSADSEQVETKRAQYIAIQTVRRILPPALRAAGFALEADQCEHVESVQAAAEAAEAAAWAARAAAARAAAARAAARAADAARAAEAADAARAAEAADAVRAAEAADAVRAAEAADAVRAAAWAADAARAAEAADAVRAAEAADAVRAAAWAADAAAAKLEHADIWTVAIEILDGALHIGRQAPEIDGALAQARLDTARARRETRETTNAA